MEIGTGYGYQQRSWARGKRQYTASRSREIAVRGKRLRAWVQQHLLRRNGAWAAEHAPYDRSMVTAAPSLIPVRC